MFPNFNRTNLNCDLPHNPTLRTHHCVTDYIWSRIRGAIRHDFWLKLRFCPNRQILVNLHLIIKTLYSGWKIRWLGLVDQKQRWKIKHIHQNNLFTDPKVLQSGLLLTSPIAVNLGPHQHLRANWAPCRASVQTKPRTELLNNSRHRSTRPSS